MPAAPDSDLVTFIAAGGLSLTAGTNLFAGPERAPGTGIPTAAVFVLASGGYAPEPFTDGSGKDWMRPTVQITVRSAPNDFAGGKTRARAILNLLRRAVVSGYALVHVRESEPNYIGALEDGMHLWTVNVALEHRTT